ncbi:hypothetical protein PRIC2_014024 [Phytophthora ramorum]
MQLLGSRQCAEHGEAGGVNATDAVVRVHSALHSPTRQPPLKTADNPPPNMAAIVPISCNQSWRSRSRNASTDSDFLGLVPTSPSVGELSIDLLHEAADDGDEEEKGVERVESPHTLIMPREFAAQEPAWPVVRPNNAKAMERRRASGF